MSAPRVLVLNGPNLGRLGAREPQTYGRTTYAELAASLTSLGEQLGLRVEVRQTDAESEMLGWLHDAADARLPVVLNPGGWSHTSVALRDACAMLAEPLLEVHISNVHAREAFRHTSYVSAVATGVLTGLGTAGYALALRWLAERWLAEQLPAEQLPAEQSPAEQLPAERWPAGRPDGAGAQE